MAICGSRDSDTVVREREREREREEDEDRELDKAELTEITCVMGVKYARGMW